MCSLGTVRPIDASDFVHSRLDSGLSASIAVLHNRRAALRLLFRVARRLELVESDPTLDLGLPPKSPGAARPLDDGEIELCRDVAHWTSSRVAIAWALAEATARESICTVLQVAVSTYYAAKRRQLAPSARAVRDAAMIQILMVLWVANRKVYRARKLWKAAQRAGHEVGRDQVARLMRSMQIEGVSRQRRKVFTTRQDPDAQRAPDLVNRNFTADRPDALRVTDLTYVPTRTGMAYVCFIVDAFSRRIVGWRVG